MPHSTGPKVPSEQNGYTAHAVDIHGREILNPAASWTPFWKPRFVAASPALAHIPFLFWLIENHAPQRIVQLGVGDGVGYLALCQAVDKLGLNAACRGISLRGGQEPGSDAVAHHDKMYEDFSILSVEELPTANRHYRKGGIDLLVINTPLEAEIAGVLADKWNGLMSDRGLIVVFDSKEQMAREGAHPWLIPLLDTHPAIELEQGDGLIALATGPNQDGRISRLADLELGMAGYREARQVFQALGDRIVAGHCMEELQVALETRTSSFASAKNELAHIQQEFAKARAAEDNANEQLASMHANTFDLENERSELAAKLAAADSDRRALEEEMAAELSRLEAELSARNAQAEKFQVDLLKSKAAQDELSSRLNEADLARLDLEQQLSGEQSRLESELSAKNTELQHSSEKYRERLADIAELGHILAAKENELKRLRAQHEDGEIRSHVLAQLAIAKGKLKQNKKAKFRLLPGRSENSAVAEDAQLVSASDYFDAEWYLAFYPDVAEAGVDPVRHFVTEGAYELRNPGPRFDSLKYHKANPDVTAEGLAGFIHYIRHGRSENREAFPVGERR